MRLHESVSTNRLALTSTDPGTSPSAPPASPDSPSAAPSADPFVKRLESIFGNL